MQEMLSGAVARELLVDLQSRPVDLLAEAARLAELMVVDAEGARRVVSDLERRRRHLAEDVPVEKVCRVAGRSRRLARWAVERVLIAVEQLGERLGRVVHRDEIVVVEAVEDG